MYIVQSDRILTYIEYQPQFNGFNVSEFGQETNDRKSFNSVLAYRYNYIIHFVIDGTGSFYRDGKVYHLSPGKAFVLTPKNLIRYEADENTSWTYCWLAFSGSDCDELFKTCGFSDRNIVFDFTSSDIQPLTQFLDLIKGEQPKDENAFKLSVNAMAFQVLSNCSKNLRHEQLSPKIVSSSIIDTALVYMKTNLHRPINITSLCKELCISRTYFSTLFENTMKVAPYTYLQNIRIQRASELLLNDKNLRICEIAEMVGFSSTAQFCKAFKKTQSISPSEFAKKYRNTNKN